MLRVKCKRAHRHICCSHTRMVTSTVDRTSITIHSSYVCIRDSGKILQRGYHGDIALIHHRLRVGGICRRGETLTMAVIKRATYVTTRGHRS